MLVQASWVQAFSVEVEGANLLAQGRSLLEWGLFETAQLLKMLAHAELGTFIAVLF